MSSLTITALPSRNPDPSTATAHHVGNPPTSFKNPWPSFRSLNLSSVFATRFGSHPEKNMVPVPQGPNGTRSPSLVAVRKPDWGASHPSALRATWLGHATFLIETPAAPDAARGLRILFDPVFSERTSPFTFLGPKRYTPTPCSLAQLPEVDAVVISHNHYDHMDISTLQHIYSSQRNPKPHFFVPLNNAQWFHSNICPADAVTELDWWQSVEFRSSDKSLSAAAAAAAAAASITLTCTPSQHGSARSPFDKDRALWSSWCLQSQPSGKTLYFAGDTAYQAVETPTPCPAFAEIGAALGPFDLALLPIGLFKPQSFMGSVHASPEQSLQIHRDIRAKLSLGMHYGTVRGGISAHYEDVTEPPRRWREAAEEQGRWRGGGVEGNGGQVETTGGDGVGLCDVGETVAV